MCSIQIYSVKIFSNYVKQRNKTKSKLTTNSLVWNSVAILLFLDPIQQAGISLKRDSNRFA